MSWKLLRLCLLASFLLALCTFFLYRGTHWPLGLEGIAAGGASVLLLALTLVFLLWRRLARLPRLHGQSATFGLLIGLLWTVEICMNNILQPGLPLRDTLDDLFWALIALLILAVSIAFAYRANNFLQGLLAGCWSGFSSGAVACL